MCWQKRAISHTPMVGQSGEDAGKTEELCSYATQSSGGAEGWRDQKGETN